MGAPSTVRRHVRPYGEIDEIFIPFASAIKMQAEVISGTNCKDSPAGGFEDRLRSLVAVTAFGMVGLTSYWVAQRRRQIGIRRALGATRLAIMRQFQRENLLIATKGVLAGILLALALNIWLVGKFGMVRLDTAYVIDSGIVMLLLGQIAVFWPAMRAAEVPPALAVRGSQIS